MGIISDLATLVRAGVNVADVMKLANLSEAEQPKTDVVVTDETKEEVTPVEEVEADEDAVDYKAKYEELLTKTQSDNLTKSMPIEETKTTDEMLQDVLKEILS